MIRSHILSSSSLVLVCTLTVSQAQAAPSIRQKAGSGNCSNNVAAYGRSISIKCTNLTPKQAKAPEELPQLVNKLLNDLGRIPRVGNGPDAYKNIPDAKLADWSLAEYNKVRYMVEEVLNAPTPRGGKEWMFQIDFRQCCKDNLTNLRSELRRRLGPDGKDFREMQGWEQAFPTSLRDSARDALEEEGKSPEEIQQFLLHIPPEQPRQLYPLDINNYLPYFRRIVIKLRDKDNPPKAIPLSFSTLSYPSLPQGDSHATVEVTTECAIESGYLAIEHSGTIHAVDFCCRILRRKSNDWDDPKLKRLNNAPGSMHAFSICDCGFSPSNPFYITIFDQRGFTITAASLVPE